MLRNMLKICLVFWKCEPQYAYKRYAFKKAGIKIIIAQFYCYCLVICA